jgi:ABC-type nitrate/sulfonate/bicarbonate transport system substrate-binding protein
MTEGFFAKHHIDVTLIDNQPPGATNLVVSGRVDIATMAAAPQTLLLAEQGKQTYITYGGIRGGIGGSLLARPGLTIASLQKLPNCRIATWPPGTSAYGWAILYKKELGLNNCTFTIYNTPELDTAAVASGRADAVIGSSTNFAALVSDGKADFLINTADASDRAKYIPNPPAWEGVDYGLKSDLQKKATAVKAYYAGYQEAIAWMAAHGAAATAAIVLKYQAAKGLTLSQLTTSIAAITPFMAGGDVSQASWDSSLKAYATWGLTNFSSSNPLFAYGNMIDTSAPAGS